MKNFLNNFFKIEERNSTITKEILAGIIVFFAILYTIPVNASLLAKSGMSDGAAFTVVVLASATTTLFVALFTNRSFIMGSGAGISAYFVFTITGSLGYSWQEALGIVLIASLIYFVLSITGIRTKIVNSIPNDLKFAAAAALGLFLAFIGLNMGGIVTSSSGTLVQIGSFKNPVMLLSLFGIFVVLILTVIPGKINKFSIVIAMILTALVGYILGLLGVSNMPKFNFDIKINLSETVFTSFKNLNVILDPKTYAIIISSVLIMLFDSTGSLVALMTNMDLVDKKGNLIDAKKIMFADSTSVLVSNSLGSLPTITLAESMIGVKNGARTGLSSLVASLLIFSTFITFPIFSIFSPIIINGVAYTPVTTLALIYVGIMLFSNIRNINFNNQIVLFSSFIIIIMTIFTYSFVNGLGIGFTCYILMMLATKKYKEIDLVIYFISGFYILSIVIDYMLLA